MTLYKLVKREERIKDLIESLPEKENHYKRKLYVIDSSFKHQEMSECGKVERALFKSKMDELIEKERAEMRAEMRRAETTGHNQIEQTLHNYGILPYISVRKQQNYRALYQASTPLLQRQIQNQPPTKKVYLERKYSSQLAYEMHTIIQAKHIEDAKLKTKVAIDKAECSPLVRNMMKVTRK